MPKAALQSSSMTTMMVWAAVTLSLGGVCAITIITITRPATDNTAIVGTILGFLVPSVLALIAMIQQQMHLAMNSRLTELLELTEKASRAEGKLEGQPSKEP